MIGRYGENRRLRHYPRFVRLLRPGALIGGSVVYWCLIHGVRRSMRPMGASRAISGGWLVDCPLLVASTRDLDPLPGVVAARIGLLGSGLFDLL